MQNPRSEKMDLNVSFLAKLILCNKTCNRLFTWWFSLNVHFRGAIHRKMKRALENYRRYKVCTINVSISLIFLFSNKYCILISINKVQIPILDTEGMFYVEIVFDWHSLCNIFSKFAQSSKPSLPLHPSHWEHHFSYRVHVCIF